MPVATVRLEPPRTAALPAPLGQHATAAQAGVLRALTRHEKHLRVDGPPGAGRTRLALSCALQADEPVLVLAPRRTSAGILRDAVAHAGGAEHVQVATPAAAGLDLVARATGRRPTLVTGADQDTLLAQIIEAIPEVDWQLPLDPASRLLPGFRHELRDLISRCIERGIGPERLTQLAARHARPGWADGALVLRTYLDVLDLESTDSLDATLRLDSAAMVRRAADCVERGEVAAAPLLVVDDVQDLTGAGIALVRAHAEAGSRLVLLSAADQAVETFRGAHPDAARRILDGVSRGVEQHLLPVSHRTPRELGIVHDALAPRLPLEGAPTDLRRPLVGPPVDGRADAVVLADVLEEARVIAGALRAVHHEQQVPYDDLAVVVRSRAVAEDLADRLQREGLPVTTATRPRPLREERAVADLLTLVQIARAGSDTPPQDVLDLLRGPYGGSDPLRLRRLRRGLLEACGDPVADSAQLLARAVLGEDLPGLPGPDAPGRAAAGVHRLRRMVRAVRAQPQDATADLVLWEAWDAARVADRWQEAAVTPDDTDPAGARGRLAGRRLDAVTALFAAAERFVDRRPDASVEDFAAQVMTQAVPEDTLAPAAQLRGRVRVATPAELAGTEVDTVVLARVQEGVWPDLRLRSTLLGAADLDVLADGAVEDQPARLRALQRQNVLEDELRLAVSALGRARHRLLVTAVEDDDSTPSALHRTIARAIGTARRGRGESAGEDTGAEEGPSGTAQLPWLADPGPAPDAHRLIGALRRHLQQQDSPADSDQAARDLAALAAAGLRAASPHSWYHLDPSSSEPLPGPDAPLRMGPSALGLAADCPQAWLLSRAGGQPAPGAAQRIGTALHRLAQEDPAGTDPDLLTRLHHDLAPLHLDGSWSGRRQLHRAEEMLERTREYLAQAPPALAVEVPFRLEVGAVELRGAIDRVEGDPDGDGGVRVIDLKTGRSALTAAQAEKDLQLAAYQRAVREGLLGEDTASRLVGADLVYVGTGTRTATLRSQAAPDSGEDWFPRIVRDVAADLSGDTVEARPSARCSTCPARRSCALQPEGRQL
ncbi:ATP-dependent helicase [Brachybacterium sp. EF45031]|uniref:UrvD/REP family ATP-dependent DNA helicase n=1 Tax=Brachybacterium sillae TaxID=2810536 RepID=UPI00217DBB58|nr:UrvD/REP family ATP-dependent DNA helicase [Brachybacterium sillae]MCS6712451.1 ATP-dependent helicase [Brachybacterium sillae]